jgi:RES domain
MGSKPKIVELSANLSQSGGIATAELGALFTPTNRLNSGTKTDGEVDAWSKSDDLRSNDLVNRVQQALRQCPALVGSDLQCFRGRTFESDIPSSKDMGPPPKHFATENRYNGDGQPVLYLCTVRAAVEMELHNATNIWIQEFQVPVQSMRIADLRQKEDCADDLLNLMMWHAELAGTVGYATRQFSQFVAHLVSSHFDGMLVPGVQGNSSLRYQNLVIFRPLAAWQEWLAPDAPTLATHLGVKVVTR